MNILILFGGRSAEHEVSVTSSKYFFKNLDHGKHDVTLVGLTPSGQWRLIPETDYEDLKKVTDEDGLAASLFRNSQSVVLKTADSEIPIDLAIPVLHGPYGEDGCPQGVFEGIKLPYFGSEILSSALCMDKITLKKMLQYHNIKTARFLSIDKWSQAPEFSSAADHLGLPLFIKPSNMGSSIGVSKVTDKTEFQSAIDLALKYDDRVLIEEAINGREIEISVYEYRGKLQCSDPGEIIAQHDFYSYEAKYIDPDGAQFQIPANLPKPLKQELKSLAIKCFQLLNCRHFARMDFFVTAEEEIFLNEPNTIPGCTPISMFPKMIEKSGLRFSKFLENLIKDQF